MLLMLLKSAFVTQSGYFLILVLSLNIVVRTFPTGEGNNTI